MSELKEIDARELVVNNHYWPNEESMRVYLKSEADEVISTIKAERDEYRYNLSCARNEIHNLSVSMKEDVKTIAEKDKEIVKLKEQVALLQAEFIPEPGVGDGETLDAYLKELVNVAHSTSKDGDDAMASTFMLDSLGPLIEKTNVKKKM